MFLTSLAFQFGERLSFFEKNNVDAKTENDHDPEITCFGIFSIIVSFIPTYAILNSETSEYIPQT